MLWQEPALDIVPAARELGVGLVPYSPLGRGLLTATLDRAGIDSSEFRRTDPRFQDASLVRNLDQIQALRWFAGSLSITPAQLALAWLLAQGDDVVPIPGTRRLDRVVENSAAVEVQLSQADLERLKSAVRPEDWAGDRHSFAVPATTRTAT
jgi:aryl-alcohol dehydrogenase-like predicted oxidoreductase